MLRGCAAVLLAAAALLAAEPAQAGDDEIAMASVLGVLGAVDAGYGIYDLVVLAEERDVSPEVATSQLITTGLQTNALQVAMIGLAQDREHDVVFALTFPAMLTSALASHGAWSLAQPDADQGRLVLGSSIIGVNYAYTNAAIAEAAAGHASPLPIAVGQILTAVPNISLSAYQLSQDSTFRSGWLFLTTWSSGLLLHGVVSLFHQKGIRGWGSSEPGPRRAAGWSIEAAPTLSVVPDGRGGVTPVLGIAGQL